MSFHTTLKEGWHAFLDRVDHLKHPEDDYITFDDLEDMITDPKTSPQERLRWQAFQVCLYGDVHADEIPNGDVRYGCKYVRYEECGHFGEIGGVKAGVEMSDVRRGQERGRTMVVVEKVGGLCKACGEREKRRELEERGRYWRGLV